MLANIESAGPVRGAGISARYFNFPFIYGNPQTSVCGFPSVLGKIEGGHYKNVLILSSHTDSSACVLFGLRKSKECSLNEAAETVVPSPCHSERSEESLFLFR
jgi:hypothetical protein